MEQARWTTAHRTVGAVAPAATAVDAEVRGEVVALGAEECVGMALKQIAGPSGMAKGLGVEVAVAVVAALDIVVSGPDEEGWAAWAVPAAVVAFDHAGHTGSLAAVAFADFVIQPDGPHPNCYRQQVVVVQGLEADSVRVHPTVDLVDLLWYQQADTLVDGRLAVMVRRLDLAGRWSVDL